MRCLVVDDEPTARGHLRLLLARHGKVDETENAAVAIELVRAAVRAGNPYDLVCIDLSMPGPSGLEMVGMVREVDRYMQQGARTGVVVVTASSEREDMSAAYREHADAYLVKPVSMASLDEALRKVGRSRKGGGT
jgi:two-component system chemotaxis response regulator CheY